MTKRMSSSPSPQWMHDRSAAGEGGRGLIDWVAMSIVRIAAVKKIERFGLQHQEAFGKQRWDGIVSGS